MAGGNVEFNLQQYLADMRGELREAHETLVAKVDQGFEKAAQTIAEHELDDIRAFAALDGRIKPLEETQSSVKWALRTVAGAFLLFAFDFVVNHLPRLASRVTTP